MKKLINLYYNNLSAIFNKTEHFGMDRYILMIVTISLIHNSQIYLPHSPASFSREVIRNNSQFGYILLIFLRTKIYGTKYEPSFYNVFCN
jgi:hypothetical protein